MNTAGQRRAHSLGWFLVIFAALGALRVSRWAGPGPYGLDASFYFQIARNVAGGEGLLTNVSLYFEGWKLPAITTIYPLWPLVLGFAGRLIGLGTAANVLPPVLYLVSLPLFFLLARRVCRDLAVVPTRRWWLPDTEHALLTLFGLNPSYFSASTHPYTEGLAFVTGCAALLALGRSSRQAAAAGGFAALAFLTRSQMICIVAGIAGVLARDAWRDRKRWKNLVAYTAPAATLVLIWIVYVRFVPGYGVIAGRNDRVALPPFDQQVRAESFLELLADRAKGLVVAFDASSDYSYVHNFGPVAFLVPLAALVWLINRRAGSMRRPGASGLATQATVASGLIFLVTLFLFHGDFFLPWLFGWRHGIPLIFLLAVAIPYLLTREQRWLRIGATAVVIVSLGMSAVTVWRFVRTPDGFRFSSAESGVMAFLSTRVPKPMVITTHAQTLAVGSSANFHWTICKADPATTRVMLQRLPIDYVFVYEGEQRCRFVQGLGDVLQPLAAFGGGPDRIYVLGRKPAAAAPSR